MRYAFYPGCAQESSAREYRLSAEVVCRELGVELEEIPRWNCCGASSGHFLNEELSLALAARNLALAERMNPDQPVSIVTICPACYLRLKTAQVRLRNSPKLRQRVEKLAGLPCEAKCEVRHLLDVLVNSVGLENIEGRIRSKLEGFKLVAYYGCYLVRPPEVAAFDDPEDPMMMDRLLRALGADVPDWGGKVNCCGGSLTLSRPDLVSKLASGLIEQALEVGAQGIVVACAMCHYNLEAGQKRRQKLPIFYFTEFLSLALGLSVKPSNKCFIAPPRLRR